MRTPVPARTADSPSAGTHLRMRARIRVLRANAAAVYPHLHPIPTLLPPVLFTKSVPVHAEFRADWSPARTSSHKRQRGALLSSPCTFIFPLLSFPLAQTPAASVVRKRSVSEYARTTAAYPDSPTHRTQTNRSKPRRIKDRSIIFNFGGGLDSTVTPLRLGCPSPLRSPAALRFGSAAPVGGSGCPLSGVGTPQSRVALAAGCPREFRLLPGVAFVALWLSGTSRASYVSHFPELLLLHSRGRERLTAACGRVTGHFALLAPTTSRRADGFSRAPDPPSSRASGGSGCPLSGVGTPQSRVALAAGCPREFRLLPGVAFVALWLSGTSRASYVSHFPELLLLHSRGRERLTAACGRV
ncbi:hypothetical protein C8F04DRAFT_1398001 [Mycena alexandri]|uniref:Uncharacterized protein n=1 Tax=Mycena alexandri TaxID=1745969 RepID=A0AAD6SQZ2_9AGAR|nr:hypothetical protein C8F04DRAFT_1398001 [Mycena alexandri]